MLKWLALLINSFNKTEAAVFSCRLGFLRAFPFISLILHRINQCAFLICMAHEQVDLYEILNPSLAFALYRCIQWMYCLHFVCAFNLIGNVLLKDTLCWLYISSKCMSTCILLIFVNLIVLQVYTCCIHLYYASVNM